MSHKNIIIIIIMINNRYNIIIAIVISHNAQDII